MAGVEEDLRIGTDISAGKITDRKDENYSQEHGKTDPNRGRVVTRQVVRCLRAKARRRREDRTLRRTLARRAPAREEVKSGTPAGEELRW